MCRQFIYERQISLINKTIRFMVWTKIVLRNQITSNQWTIHRYTPPADYNLDPTFARQFPRRIPCWIFETIIDDCLRRKSSVLLRILTQPSMLTSQYLHIIRAAVWFSFWFRFNRILAATIPFSGAFLVCSGDSCNCNKLTNLCDFEQF